MTIYGARLIEEFAEAAKNHGWQEDQGTGPPVDAARERYEKARAELEKYLSDLEVRTR